MKRIYMALATIAAFSMGTYAQSVDLEGYILPRTEGVTIYPGERLDTNKIACFIIYNGPDDIYGTTDAVLFMTSFSPPADEPGSFYMSGVGFNRDLTMADSGQAIFVFPNDNMIGQGHIDPWTVSADSINLLIDWDKWNFEDSIILADKPYVEGKEYGFYFRPVRVADRSTGDPVATDPKPENNIAIARIIWGGGESGITIPGREKAEISLYPNPAVSEVNFSFNFTNPSHAMAVVRDVTGRIVSAKNFGRALPGTQKFTLDVSSLSAGTYTVEFSTDEAMAVSKFTISK